MAIFNGVGSHWSSHLEQELWPIEVKKRLDGSRGSFMASTTTLSSFVLDPVVRYSIGEPVFWKHGQ